MPLIPDIAVFQRKLATLPLVTYRAGETVLKAASTTPPPNEACLLRFHHLTQSFGQ
jgi:hypothetical protein